MKHGQNPYLIDKTLLEYCSELLKAICGKDFEIRDQNLRNNTPTKSNRVKKRERRFQLQNIRNRDCSVVTPNQFSNIETNARS